MSTATFQERLHRLLGRRVRDEEVASLVGHLDLARGEGVDVDGPLQTWAGISSPRSNTACGGDTAFIRFIVEPDSPSYKRRNVRAADVASKTEMEQSSTASRPVDRLEKALLREVKRRGVPKRTSDLDVDLRKAFRWLTRGSGASVVSQGTLLTGRFSSSMQPEACVRVQRGCAKCWKTWR